MNQILLDTTVLIDALRNRNQRLQELAALVASGKILVTSTINVAEVFGGLRPAEEARTQFLLDGLEIFPVTASIAERAGKLKTSLRIQGITRSILDMIVAATALEYGMPLATDNRKDFQIEGLDLFPLQ